MEKLIQYLNQHRIELCDWNTTNLIKFKYSSYTFNLWDLWEQNTELLVISKQYWFIKRLVEYDKIDRHSEELELDMKRMRIPQDYYISWVQSLDLQHKKAQYLSLIALLSIQDEPIEFLVSVLK